MNDIKSLIYYIYDGRCAYCGMPLLFQFATLDHIIPKAKSGGNSKENLALACESCNQRKRDLDLEEFRKLFPSRKKLFGKKTPYRFYAERNNLGVFAKKE